MTALRVGKGPTGPNFITGGSGSSVGLASATVFTGLDSQSATEQFVAHILPTSMTFGHMYCEGPKVTSGSSSVTFTVRIGTPGANSIAFASSTLTCSITSGGTFGTGTGTAAFTAGQTIDVQVVGGSGATAAAVSWGVAP